MVHSNWDLIIPLECRSKPTILRFTTRLMWEEAHERLHGDIDPNKTSWSGTWTSVCQFTSGTKSLRR
ncbi:probable carbohydrate esterase At4g34215, partial [Olea europaea subsp. europaea]